MTAPSEQAVTAVVELAQKVYDQGELIADLASGITGNFVVDGEGPDRTVSITLVVTPEVALRLQNATGVAIPR